MEEHDFELAAPAGSLSSGDSTSESKQHMGSAPSGGRVDSLRRPREGFCSRKRIGLKINADLNVASDSSLTDKPSEASVGDHAHQSRDTTDTPWWIMEYQCPPPGHLGAHSVDVPLVQQISDAPAITALQKGFHVRGLIKTETQNRLTTEQSLDIHPYSSYKHSPGQKRKFGATEKGEKLNSPSIIASKELKHCHLTSSCQMLETPPLNDVKGDLFPDLTIITPTKGAIAIKEADTRTADGPKSTHNLARTI